MHELTRVWNEGSTVFDAIRMDVTDTASAASSRLLELAVGGVSQFRVDRAGNATLSNALTCASVLATGNVSSNAQVSASSLNVTNEANVGGSVTAGSHVTPGTTGLVGLGWVEGGFLRDDSTPSVDFYCKPSTAFAPINNGELTIDAPTNETIRIRRQGTDGIVRSVTLNLTAEAVNANERKARAF